MRRLIGLVLGVVLALAPAMAVAETPLEQSRRLVREAFAAHESGDAATALTRMSEALALRPGHPGLLLNVASLQAETGDGAAAAETLAAYARTGLTADLTQDPAFAPLHGTPAFESVSAMLAENAKPIGKPERVAVLGAGDALFEAVVRDAKTGRLFAGSVRERRIVVVDPDGKTRNFVPKGRDGLMSVFGLAIDPAHGLLWAASTGTPLAKDLPADMKGKAGLFAFDLETGALVRKALFAGEGERWIGDLVLAPDGTVYASDSLNPVLYRLAPGETELTEFIRDAIFASPQGLALSSDGSRLLVADYAMGIVAVDIAARKATLLAPPPDTALLAIDELTSDGETVIAVQQLTPSRVLKVALSPGWDRIERVEVLAANSPLHDEPTLGQISEGAFYYVANSQWPRFGDDGSVKGDAPFTDAVVARLPLPR